MSTEKVAVVTGSNKGIGFAIVKGLCEKFNGVVYLTARDVTRGEEAVKKLKELGFNPLFHQLDITDQASIDRFKEYIQKKHGGIDILVNNAAILFMSEFTEGNIVSKEELEETVRVNYFGTLRVCETLFPLLRNNAKVINVSSSVGHLSQIPSAELRAKFSNPSLTINDVNSLMEKFVQDVKDNRVQQEGWPNYSYHVSKVGLSALSFLQQKSFEEEIPNRNISVNAVHPGYVSTDLNNHTGPLTIEEGAKSPLYVALEADFKGKYVWSNCQVVDWYADDTPTRF